jgi:hypothetical protein
VVVPIAEGATNGDTRWQITDDGAVIVDTDPTTWGKTNLGLVAVVDDLSPTLGGNLDCNTKSVTSASEVGIGLAAPGRKLDVLDSAGVSDAAVPQLRLTHTDGANFADVGSTADGYFLAQPSGSAGYSFFRGSGNSYIVIQDPSITKELTPASFPDTAIGMQIGIQAKVCYMWLRPEDTVTGAAIKIGVDHSTLIIDEAGGTKNVQVVGNATLGATDSDVHTVNGTLRTRFPLTTVAAATYTLTATENNSIVHVAYSTTGTCAVTLPAIASCPAGTWFQIKDANGDANINNITVTPNGGTIDGDATITLNQSYTAVQIYSDGSNWFLSP